MTRSFRALMPYVAALAIALAFAAPAAAQDAAATVPAAQAMKDLPLTAEQRQGLVATYTVVTPEGQMSFRIFEEAGVLKGAPGEGEAKRLLHQGGNVFHPEGMPEFKLTFTMEGAKATKFVAVTPEFTLEATRAP